MNSIYKRRSDGMLVIFMLLNLGHQPVPCSVSSTGHMKYWKDGK